MSLTTTGQTSYSLLVSLTTVQTLPEDCTVRKDSKEKASNLTGAAGFASGGPDFLLPSCGVRLWATRRRLQKAILLKRDPCTYACALEREQSNLKSG